MMTETEHLKSLLRELFALADIVEMTDEGREFHPNVMGHSCRVMDGHRMNQILGELRRVAHAPNAGWLPIDTAPRDGTWILLAGPSGYGSTPLRVEVCRYDPDYRPLNPWQTHSNDAFTDGGPEPTHWLPLPTVP